MLLYISAHHEFKTGAIVFRWFSEACWNIPSRHYNNNKICLWIFNLRSPLALGKRNCEIYFIVSVVLGQQILAGLGKVAERQSIVLWILDVQKCTVVLWFETKENYNENNMSENQGNIFLSCSWKLDVWKYFNLFETPVLRLIWISLIEGQV